MRPRRMQTDTNLMQSFKRSTQLQSQLHAALINVLCRRCGAQRTVYSKSNDVRRYAVAVELSA